MQMTADDICNILKTCAEANVAHLSLGKLQVTFKESQTPPINYMEVGDPLMQDVLAGEAVERDELVHKDEELARLEIEDPVAYEKAILSGDLIYSKVGEQLDENDSGPE
jgi:hypothetical protein